MAKKSGGFLGGKSPSVGANIIEGITGVNVDPDPLGIRKKNEDPSNPSADALAKIATDLYNKTDPIRTNLIGRSNDFLSGNLDVTKSPMFGSLKSALDTQFARARDNTLARTAPGGSLVSALTNLEGDRARTMTQGVGDIADQELNRAYGFATGLLPQTTAGLGTAAGIQAQTLAGQQAQSAAAKNGAGAGVGMLLASFLS
ncbi:MAG TPA: hypothetical protein VIW26_16610 [Gemmatimonadales bacterium]|jgi:hypothetical protein